MILKVNGSVVGHGDDGESSVTFCACILISGTEGWDVGSGISTRKDAVLNLSFRSTSFLAETLLAAKFFLAAVGFVMVNVLV